MYRQRVEGKSPRDTTPNERTGKLKMDYAQELDGRKKTLKKKKGKQSTGVKTRFVNVERFRSGDNYFFATIAQ